MIRYGFHPEARVDIDEIWKRIRGDSPNAAERVVEEILSRIAALPLLPNQGHKRTDLTSRPLRFVVVYEYMIAYAPDHRPLWVVAVFHGRRSPIVMASILDARQ
jgi:plasmid stabilization system protein ParE